MSRDCGCLTVLSQKDKAATRCLAVLNRIWHHIQQQGQSISDCSRSTFPASLLQADPEFPSAILAGDPSLQTLFEDPSWDNDLFHGLRGFPSTDVGVFDYRYCQLPISRHTSLHVILVYYANLMQTLYSTSIHNASAWVVQRNLIGQSFLTTCENKPHSDLIFFFKANRGLQGYLFWLKLRCHKALNMALWCLKWMTLRIGR